MVGVMPLVDRATDMATVSGSQQQRLTQVFSSLEPHLSAIAVFIAGSVTNALIVSTLTGVGPNAWDGRVYFGLAILSTPFILTLHPASPLRRALYYVPLLLLLCAFRSPVGPSNGAYQFGILLASWSMRIMDRLYLHDPEKTFLYSNKITYTPSIETDKKEKKDGDEKAKEQPAVSPATFSSFAKLAWASELMVITRGIGWNWQIHPVPPLPEDARKSRAGFLWLKAREAIKKVATLSLIKMGSALLLQLAEQPQQGAPLYLMFLSRFNHILLHPVFLHLFMYASWANVVYSSLDLAENILALIFVGFRLTERWSRPEMWAPVFGKFGDSYSIRRGWGVFWHQNMRRVCQSPADYLVSKIPFINQPKTQTAKLIRRYARLLLVFVFSGVIHAGGSIYMAQRGFSLHTTDGGNVSGFAYQGMSLILEDAVLALLGIDDITREREGTQTWIRKAIGFAIVHGYAAYATPALKVIPLGLDHGLVAPGGPLMIGVKMVGNGATGVLSNPFATMVGSFNV